MYPTSNLDSRRKGSLVFRSQKENTKHCTTRVTTQTIGLINILFSFLCHSALEPGHISSLAQLLLFYKLYNLFIKFLGFILKKLELKVQNIPTYR